MVKLFVEGGGDTAYLHSECRKAFSLFLDKAGFKGHMPRIVASGGRSQAYDSFRTAIMHGEKAVLLIDSEKAVSPAHKGKPWDHLRSCENWDWLPNLKDENCHLMVQVMESWFIADPACIKQYFNVSASIPNKSVEFIAKADVMKILNDCARKSKHETYDKGRDSFKLLATVNPDKVKAHSEWSARFIIELEKIMKNA